MARIKILSSAVENPNANNISNATMVSLTATSGGAVTHKNAAGNVTYGTLYVPANATVLIEKEPTDTLTHAAAWATKIAYNV